MKSRTMLLLLVFIGAMMLMTGCVPGDGANDTENLAGFFWGIWHGWVAPISLVLGIFKSEIRLYEVYNSGWLYDLGFYVAVISGFGGISLFRRKKK